MLENSDDFVFDNQMIAQAVMFGFRIGEISCPTKYFEEASSINFRRSVKYGLGVLATTVSFVAHKAGIIHAARFDATGRKVTQQYYSEVARGDEGGKAFMSCLATIDVRTGGLFSLGARHSQQQSEGRHGRRGCPLMAVILADRATCGSIWAPSAN